MHPCTIYDWSEPKPGEIFQCPECGVMRTNLPSNSTDTQKVMRLCHACTLAQHPRVVITWTYYDKTTLQQLR